MGSNFNLNNDKLINVNNASLNSDAVNLEQLNETNSAVATTVSKSYLKKDGTVLLTGNLNLNGHKITNLQKGTQESDSINLKQLNESHIKSHTNRESVFEYVMKLSSEFSVEFE